MTSFLQRSGGAAAVGLGAFAATILLGGVLGPNVHMVNRETSLDPYKRYVINQELENVGRAGNATFLVIQHDRVVCKKHVFLRKNERREFTLSCPAMADGDTIYRIRNG